MPGIDASLSAPPPGMQGYCTHVPGMERPFWGPHFPNVGVEFVISNIDSTLADETIGPTLLVQMRPQSDLSSYCGTPSVYSPEGIISSSEDQLILIWGISEKNLPDVRLVFFFDTGERSVPVLPVGPFKGT